MYGRELQPFRLVLIGLLLVGPSMGVLLALAWQGHLHPGTALALSALVAAVSGMLLRLIHQDTKTLVGYAERLAEGGAPVPLPLSNTVSAEAVMAAMARTQARWLDRTEAGQRRVEAAEAVVDGLHDPLLLVGADRRVIRANNAARALFGDRMVGRDLAVSLRNPGLLEAVDAVRNGGASRSVEFLLPVPVERTLEARVKPFTRPGPTGGELGPEEPRLLLTLHDITLLKRSEQMRADFVANASHELRTPLAALIGFIETLRGPARDDTEARDRFLGIMHDQSSRMSRLVNDLLSLSRIELDEHSPPTDRVDVAEIVRRVAATLELRAAGRKIRLKVEGPETLPEVVGDEDQLTQVFQNLIDNAIKYGKEQTEVTVGLSVSDPASSISTLGIPVLPGRGRGGRNICVSVRDRGDGIPRTHLPRLTERFYRVDPARSRALGGTGLGLAIVKHIVNRHRGRLTIDSEVGKGSTFTVHLPTAEEAAPAVKADVA